MAVKWEKKESFKSLFDLGLPMNAGALSISAANTDPFYLDELLRRGVDVNLVYDSYAPIHWAAADIYIFNLKKLVERNVNVNLISNISGKTTLDLAIERNQPKTIEYLRSIGESTAAELRAEGRSNN